MKQTILLIGVISFLTLIIVGFGMYIGYTNTEIDLRESVEAQQKTCKANHDKMFKTIARVAQVPQEFMNQARKSFSEIYPKLMEGRYGNQGGGALMLWIQESTPEFDLNSMKDLYKEVQVAVEANRVEYFVEQKKLVDKQREHSSFIKKFPARMFVNSKEIDITIVTSTNTEKAYEMGKDDDINLFK